MSLKSLYKLLDNWVSKNANGKYYSDDFIEEKEENLIVGDSYGIQQNRKEIFSFIKTVAKNKNKNICLEIGIGHAGSTHFIFRQLFKKTITIELDKNRVFDFRDRLTNYYGKYVLDDGKSHFIYGASSDTQSVLKIVNFLKNKDIKPYVLTSLTILFSHFLLYIFGFVPFSPTRHSLYLTVPLVVLGVIGTSNLISIFELFEDN
jgi:hypothetical protein